MFPTRLHQDKRDACYSVALVLLANPPPMLESALSTTLSLVLSVLSIGSS
jgi:hypothetical protein